jgi:hypothetical protein
MKMHKSFYVTVMAVCFSSLHLFGQNLLTNPDFSGPGTDWGSFGNVSFNEFFGPGFGPHASLFADSPSNEGGVFDLNIAATPGTEYEFFLNSVNIESNFDGTISLVLEYFENDNTTKISDDSLLLNLTAATGAGLGFDLSSQAVSGIAPVNTAFVRPLITFTGGQDDSGSDNAFISEATLQVIPEPGTFLLFALGMGSITLGNRIHRRRRS